MERKKPPDRDEDEWNATEIEPRAGLRDSALWKAGKPDERLAELMRILARKAARDDFEAECRAKEQEAQKEE